MIVDAFLLVGTVTVMTADVQIWLAKPTMAEKWLN